MITGKWFFPFVFGVSFSGMYQPFLLLVPGILSLSGLFTLTAYFAGKNQIKTNITGSVYALIVILAGNIIFIPKYGINAAALISSIAYIIYQGYILFVFKKEFNTPLSHFFISRFSDWQKINKLISNSIFNTKSR
jgi:O-antigen/teichoic acid export membrane protein